MNLYTFCFVFFGNKHTIRFSCSEAYSRNFDKADLHKFVIPYYRILKSLSI